MRRNTIGKLLGALGLGLVLAEFGARWWFQFHGQDYHVSPWPVLGGAIIAFVGGAIIDSKRAEQTGGFVVTQSLRVIDALPGIFGRRASDRVRIVDEKDVVAVPPAKGED